MAARVVMPSKAAGKRCSATSGCRRVALGVGMKRSTIARELMMSGGDQRSVAAAASTKEQGFTSKVMSILAEPRAWQIATASTLLLSDAASADAGKLFDFDLTMPIMAGQFLLLMVFLDKKVFTPIGNTMDERVKGVKVIKATLAERQAMKNDAAKENKALLDQGAVAAAEYVKAMEKKKMADVDSMVEEQRKEIEKELSAAAAQIQVKVDLTKKSLYERKGDIVSAVVEQATGSPVKPRSETEEASTSPPASAATETKVVQEPEAVKA